VFRPPLYIVATKGAKIAEDVGDASIVKNEAKTFSYSLGCSLAHRD